MAGSQTKKTGASHTKLLLVAFGIFILGASFSSLFNFVLDSTNTTEFCTSCHSMQWNYQQLQKSLHWKGRTGLHAGCPDCHVPKEFWPKIKAKIFAAKDVWHEIIGTIDTPEKYDAQRWYMASRVWKQMEDTDSRECRNCHSFDHMDLSEQDRMARKKHDSATDKGKTCIDCHKGITHEQPDEPDPVEKTGDK